nr:type II toxin-antitoxin system VapC family toxin [Candidatus Sigynarchaeota archaeon]
MTILDTDCIIQFLRGNPRAINFVQSARKKDNALKTTAFTVSELYFGAYISSRSAKNTRDVKDFLAQLTILDFTEAAAIVHAQITADLKSKGNPVGTIDPFIASIVLSTEESLVTRNSDHFTAIDRLKLLNWDVAPSPEP